MRKSPQQSKVAAFALLAAALLAGHLAAADREAARQVSEGIRQHLSGQYEEAAKSFAEAQKNSPENLRITFDRGCVAAAQGEFDEARDHFQSATLARDPQLTAAAYYNLGGIAVGEAKALFGPQPEEVPPDKRPEGLSLLAEGVQQYRACLRIDPQHQAARHNLEVLRLWIKQIQDVWSRRDREKRRNELGLVEYVEMLWSEQRDVRAAAEQLAREDDSPQRRRAVALVQQQQELLIEEMDPLRDKLMAELQKAAGASGGTPDQQGEVTAMLSSMVSQVRSAMTRAGGDLAIRELTTAQQAQTESLTALDDLYRGIAPFEAVLGRATTSQEQLLAAAQTQVEPAGTTEEEEVDEQEEAADDETTLPPTLDEGKVAEEQEWVSGWAEVLAPKAQQALQAMAAASPESQLPPATAAPPTASTTDEESAAANEAAAAEAQQAALRQTYQKAIELGPQVQQASTAAVQPIRERDWASAIPPQEEALRLLKEIAASLPPPPQQDPQQPDQQDDQQQGDKQEDDQQDQTPPDEQNQQEDSQSKSQGDQESQDQQEQNPEQPTPRELSKQQAESLLRQVREREREHRQRQKELRRFLRAGIKVDRDW